MRPGWAEAAAAPSRNSSSSRPRLKPARYSARVSPQASSTSAEQRVARSVAFPVAASAVANQNAPPERMKQIAAFTFIAGRPGRTLLRAGTSTAQPSNTAAPNSADRAPVTRTATLSRPVVIGHPSRSPIVVAPRTEELRRLRAFGSGRPARGTEEPLPSTIGAQGGGVYAGMPVVSSGRARISYLEGSVAIDLPEHEASLERVEDQVGGIAQAELLHDVRAVGLRRARADARAARRWRGCRGPRPRGEAPRARAW